MVHHDYTIDIFVTRQFELYTLGWRQNGVHGIYMKVPLFGLSPRRTNPWIRQFSLYNWFYLYLHRTYVVDDPLHAWMHMFITLRSIHYYLHLDLVLILFTFIVHCLPGWFECMKCYFCTRVLPVHATLHSFYVLIGLLSWQTLDLHVQISELGARRILLSQIRLI